MDLDADPLLGVSLDGRYEVVRLLAVGGMATVYEGVDTRLDRPVAIKVMSQALASDPGFVARFRREATNAARLSHPNVVPVYDQGGGASGEPVHLVMELIRGRTLRELMTERGRLQAPEALEILEPVAAALAAAHAAGIVHRDIKPENVLLGDDGRIRVADFGLARAADGGDVTTAAGLLLGTVAYLAPEQVDGQTSDTRSDVYSTGVLLFEMLTGQVPHGGDTPLAVAYQHLHVDVPPPSQLRPGIAPVVDELVSATTAREPSLRLPDGAALLARVRQARAVVGPPDGDRRTAVMPLPSMETVALQRPSVAPPAPTTVVATTAPAGKRARVEDETDHPLVRQRKRWRRNIVITTLLLLLAGAGAFGGWWLADGRWTHVPSFYDKTMAQAQLKATEAHVHITQGAKVYSDKVAVDSIASQDTPSDKRVEKGTTVVVHLSSGKQQLTVPPVPKGATSDAMRQTLHSEGLSVGQSTSEYSDTVANGLIIRTDPAAGQQVPHDTPINLVVSKGPMPVTIPDTIIDIDAGDAKNILTGLGFKVTTVNAASTDIVEGNVISSNPSPGTAADAKSSVQLTVSTGLPTTQVPDLYGLSSDDAANLLTSKGLNPDPQRQGGFFNSGDTVRAQYPASGTTVKQGTTVTYQVTN